MFATISQVLALIAGGFTMLLGVKIYAMFCHYKWIRTNWCTWVGREPGTNNSIEFALIKTGR